jgi:hypothetical protein
MASDFAAMAADSLERIVRIHGATAFGPPAGRWQEALATDIQDLQLQLLLVSESRGGASGGWPDAYTVLRLAGRYAIPLPIAEGMLAARILGSAGMAPDPGIFTIATQVNGEWTRAPSGILFTGQLSSVPWGGAADHVLCVASVAGETVVCVLARASAQVSPAHNLAGERRDVLSFKQAPATVARASGTEANSLLDYSALARLAQIAGSLSAALQLPLSRLRLSAKAIRSGYCKIPGDPAATRCFWNGSGSRHVRRAGRLRGSGHWDCRLSDRGGEIAR